MSDSFGARARKFMGWYSPEEPIDEFEDFQEYDEVEEVAPVADITPVSRPTLTAIRREEPSEDLTRIVTIHPTAYSDAVTIGERVTARVFLLSPASVEVTGDNSSSARRGSLYNQG